jgi:hypothetical protein
MKTLNMRRGGFTPPSPPKQPRQISKRTHRPHSNPYDKHRRAQPRATRISLCFMSLYFTQINLPAQHPCKTAHSPLSCPQPPHDVA